jgi:hypothetical protein
LIKVLIFSKTISFFKTPVGAAYGAVAGDQKTEIETSMDDTGKLPAGQSFLINAITISLISNSAIGTDGALTATQNQIINAFRMAITHSVWELKFTNIEYSWRDTGSIFLPSVFEASGAEHITPTLAATQSQVGQFMHYNWIKVATKVPVSELVSFSVNCTFNAGTATNLTKLNNALYYLESQKVEIRTQLKGLLIRKV